MKSHMKPTESYESCESMFKEKDSRIVFLHTWEIPIGKIIFHPPNFISVTNSLLFTLVSILPSQTDLVLSLECFLVDSNQCLHLQSIHSHAFSPSGHSWSDWW